MRSWTQAVRPLGESGTVVGAEVSARFYGDDLYQLDVGSAIRITTSASGPGHGPGRDSVEAELAALFLKGHEYSPHEHIGPGFPVHAAVARRNPGAHGGRLRDAFAAELLVEDFSTITEQELGDEWTVHLRRF